jgi:hypothetical protein
MSRRAWRLLVATKSSMLKGLAITETDRSCRSGVKPFEYLMASSLTKTYA